MFRRRGTDAKELSKDSSRGCQEAAEETERQRHHIDRPNRNRRKAVAGKGRGIPGRKQRQAASGRRTVKTVHKASCGVFRGKADFRLYRCHERMRKRARARADGKVFRLPDCRRPRICRRRIGKENCRLVQLLHNKGKKQHGRQHRSGIRFELFRNSRAERQKTQRSRNRRKNGF